MYVSTSFGTTRAEAMDFLARADFGDLVSVGPDGLTSTPLPLLYQPSPDEGLGVVVMHLARNNDHWRHADGHEGLLIIRPLDGYVTPRWYPSKAEHGRVVPTWDYEVAHVRGRLTVHDDVDWLAEAVRSLTDRHEGRRPDPWSVDDAPPKYIEGQLRAIVGLELAVSAVELKAKMSQNRPQRDIDGVIEGLDADGRGQLARAVEARRPVSD